MNPASACMNCASPKFTFVGRVLPAPREGRHLQPRGSSPQPIVDLTDGEQTQAAHPATDEYFKAHPGIQKNIEDFANTVDPSSWSDPFSGAGPFLASDSMLCQISSYCRHLIYISSVNWPRARKRARGRFGSSRVVMTRCIWDGRCSRGR